MKNQQEQVRLRYGAGEEISCDIEPARLMGVHNAPAAVADPQAALADTLASPLEFPPLRQSVFSGDRIVLAVDRGIPCVDTLIAGMWEEMAAANVQPEDLLILQPADRADAPITDPRVLLPDDVREAIDWRVHSFGDDETCGYLASSATGDRLYLSQELLEADVVMTVGQIEFDSVLGYRGVNTVFYPGLSNAEASERSNGQGHRELGPDDERPLRSLIDEIGWLLGTLFTVQTLPGETGGVSAILAGSTETVFRQGKRLLNEHWRVQLSSRCDLVVATIDGDVSGTGWHQLGAAVDAARNLVARGGRIVVLSDLHTELGEGMQHLRDSRESTDALQPLRNTAPADMLPAIQIASAADWADISLLSRLEDDVVEDLFMTPIANHREVQRAIGGKTSCMFLESAHFLATGVTG